MNLSSGFPFDESGSANESVPLRERRKTDLEGKKNLTRMHVSNPKATHTSTYFV